MHYDASEFQDTLMMSGHENNIYNGHYYLAEFWGGQPHWVNHNRTAHIYYYAIAEDFGAWNIDNRE